LTKDLSGSGKSSLMHAGVTPKLLRNNIREEQTEIRDSRGLALVLTGNITGAIEDFQAFVAWTTDEKEKAQRQHWIKALHNGEHPLTPEVLEGLR
jgi:hypothetical protein